MNDAWCASYSTRSARRSTHRRDIPGQGRRPPGRVVVSSGLGCLTRGWPAAPLRSQAGRRDLRAHGLRRASARRLGEARDYLLGWSMGSARRCLRGRAQACRRCPACTRCDCGRRVARLERGLLHSPCVHHRGAGAHVLPSRSAPGTHRRNDVVRPRPAASLMVGRMLRSRRRRGGSGGILVAWRALLASVTDRHPHRRSSSNGGPTAVFAPSPWSPSTSPRRGRGAPRRPSAPIDAPRRRRGGRAGRVWRSPRRVPWRAAPHHQSLAGT
jgi:hypothetical protein